MDIEERLRDLHPHSQQYALGSNIFLEAAEEIAELKNQIKQAESALTSVEIRSVECPNYKRAASKAVFHALKELRR